MTSSISLSLPKTIFKLVLFPFGFEDLAEIIDITEQFK
jgi:hypothetical protein